MTEVWLRLARWARKADRQGRAWSVVYAGLRAKTPALAAAQQLGVGTDEVTYEVSHREVDGSARIVTRSITQIAAEVRAGWAELPIQEDQMAIEPEIVAAHWPVWLRVLESMLLLAGWRWPVTPRAALIAAVEAAVYSDRNSGAALGRGQTGVPAETWSALELLVAGSTTNCQALHSLPSPALVHRLAGAAGVRQHPEFRRAVQAAVDGRFTRTGGSKRRAA